MFGLENHDFVDATLGDLEAVVGFVGQFVADSTARGELVSSGDVGIAGWRCAARVFVTQNDAAVRGTVNATDVHRQAAVNEHPHVVVAEEGERLAALVLEEVAKLARKMPVARRAASRHPTEASALGSRSRLRP